MRQRYYTGVGSRSTPDDVIALMESVAHSLAHGGWILRSGHAPGADQAFEAGAGRAAEVYLPWPTFERAVKPAADFVMTRPIEEAAEIARVFHPSWYSLRRGGRAMHSRNVHQVLGRHLNAPSSFLICWTRNGTLDGRDPDSGGTGQAIRIAAAYHVQVFNLARPEHRARVEEKMLTPAK